MTQSAHQMSLRGPNPTAESHLGADGNIWNLPMRTTINPKHCIGNYQMVCLVAGFCVRALW